MPKKTEKIIKPIDASIDDVAKSLVNPITRKPITIRSLPSKEPSNPISGQLNLFIDKQKEIDGIGMGVLSDGTAFLNGRGLALLCGISNARIVEMGQQWDLESPNPMTNGVKKILEDKDILVGRPYIEVSQRSGVFYAYPDAICLAVLEYYTFEQPKEEAKKNFRLLAGKALHDFIYTQVGYDPDNHVPEIWRQFHDRMSLTYNSVPSGYFGIFKEISDIIVHLGQQGLIMDNKFLPDISIGISWAKYWITNKLDQKYGDRVKYQHNYPNYFPQSDSNPQEPWCYPEMALGEFRKWVRENYIGDGKFEKYLTEKVKQKALPASFAQIAIAAYKDNEETKKIK